MKQAIHKKLKRLLFITSLLTTTFTLSNCAPRKAIDLTQRKNMAVISFNFNKYLNRDHNTKAGLLQNKAKFYTNHQKATDTLWSMFQDHQDSLFFQLPSLNKQQITKNDLYKRLTTHKKKIVMGQDMTIGNSYLQPSSTTEQFNFVSAYNTKVLTQLAEEFKTELLVIVENDLSFKKAEGMGVKFGSVGISTKGVSVGNTGVATVTLNTKLYLYDTQSQKLYVEEFSNDADKTVLLIDGDIAKKNLPEAAVNAMEKNILEMYKYLARATESAQEQS